MFSQRTNSKKSKLTEVTVTVIFSRKPLFQNNVKWFKMKEKNSYAWNYVYLYLILYFVIITNKIL
jgi:hypothetical protein